MPLDDTNWSPDTVIDETTELLVRARRFVERGWCRRASARNLLGFPVNSYSRHAVAWCASGAVQAAQAGASDIDCRRAYLRLIAAMDGELIAAFNDRQRTVEPVLAAFDKAIGLIEFVAEGEAFDHAIAAVNP